MNNNPKKKERPAKSLEMEEIGIPPCFVFISLRYLQHAFAGCSRESNLQFYSYTVLQGYNMKDAVTLAYGKSLSPGARMGGKEK